MGTPKAPKAMTVTVNGKEIGFVQSYTNVEGATNSASSFTVTALVTRPGNLQEGLSALEEIGISEFAASAFVPVSKDELREMMEKVGGYLVGMTDILLPGLLPKVSVKHLDDRCVTSFRAEFAFNDPQGALTHGMAECSLSDECLVESGGTGAWQYAARELARQIVEYVDGFFGDRPTPEDREGIVPEGNFTEEDRIAWEELP